MACNLIFTCVLSMEYIFVLDASPSISTSVSYFRRRSDLSTSPVVGVTFLACQKSRVVTSEPLARVVQLTVQEQGTCTMLHASSCYRNFRREMARFDPAIL